MIRQAERYIKKRISVDGRRMGYVDVGQGNPILFLHGNGASSYLWRNVMPLLENLGRCVAPDLIGMGRFDRLAEQRSGGRGFAEQRHMLDKFLDAVDATEKMTLVVHGWGSALGFDWANRHRGAVKGIVYMEALVMAPQLAGMVGDDDTLVEPFSPDLVMRDLTEAETAIYRLANLEPDKPRRPALSGVVAANREPTEVSDVIADYMRWLPRSPVAKLFINGEPGMIAAIGDGRALCRSFVNQSEVTVPGLHYLQEDSPEEIGQAIADWLRIMG